MKKLEVIDVKKMTDDEKSKVVKKVDKILEDDKKAVEKQKKSAVEIRKSTAEEYDELLEKEILNITQSFYNVGRILSKIQCNSYYRTLGYETIEDYAEKRFNIKRSSCYNLINVYNTTKMQGSIDMAEDYEKYNYSKLIEISKVKFSLSTFMKRISPENTVAEIKNFVKLWNDTYIKTYRAPSFNTIDEYLEYVKLNSAEVVMISESKEDEKVQTFGQTAEPKEDEKVQTFGQTTESKEDEKVQTFGQTTESKEDEKVQTFGQHSDNDVSNKIKLRQAIFSFLIKSSDILTSGLKYSALENLAVDLAKIIFELIYG